MFYFGLPIELLFNVISYLHYTEYITLNAVCKYFIHELDYRSFHLIRPSIVLIAGGIQTTTTHSKELAYYIAGRLNNCSSNLIFLSKYNDLQLDIKSLYQYHHCTIILEDFLNTHNPMIIKALCDSLRTRNNCIIITSSVPERYIHIKLDLICISPIKTYLYAKLVKRNKYLSIKQKQVIKDIIELNRTTKSFIIFNLYTDILNFKYVLQILPHLCSP